MLGRWFRAFAKRSPAFPGGNISVSRTKDAHVRLATVSTRLERERRTDRDRISGAAKQTGGRIKGAAGKALGDKKWSMRARLRRLRARFRMLWVV